MNANENESILIFCSREICYYSADFFAARISEELEKMGYHVIQHILDTEGDLEIQLGEFVGKSFLAVLDFNSLLPRMELDDGTRFLDTIDAPFFNYIVDHPFYHHPGLDIELKQYHTICIDEDHCEYIKRYYPHVKSTALIPLGATKAIHPIEIGSKKEEVLFIGTYNSSDDIYAQIKELRNQEIRSDILQMIDLLQANEEMSHEEALLFILKNRGLEYTLDEMKVHMNYLYMADRFLRNYTRENAIRILIKEEIPLAAIGNGWEESEFVRKANFHQKEAVDFSMSFQMISQYALSLNVSPIFRAGAHDRIFAAMANESVCITDTNRFMKKNFTDGKDLMLFSFHEKEKLVERTWELIENKTKREEIANEALFRFDQEFSWKNRTKQILKEILKYQND